MKLFRANVPIKENFTFYGISDYDCNDTDSIIFHYYFSVQPLKPLPLIQIEERAILELKELYHCQDNPDEYITVETVPSTSCSMLPARNGGQHSSVPFAVRVPAQVSPWGRDPKHVT